MSTLYTCTLPTEGEGQGAVIPGGYQRRDFLKITGGAVGTLGLAALGVGMSAVPQPAQAHAYSPYLTDDQLTTVVTSCAHNCGSRHVLVAHKRGT